MYLNGGRMMFEKLYVTGQNDETLLPRILRVLSKQGVQVRSLKMDAEADSLKVEIQLADVAAGQVAKLLTKQVSVVSVNTVA
jgi:acetolactate synthase regulatory subunit